MLMSSLLGERYKEKPIDASLISHVFLLRGGYIRQLSNGIFSMLTPAKRVAMKIERIIREEMDNIGGQEVFLPVVLPAKLWKETGRYDSVGVELLRFKDRNNNDMIMGMTHEEAAVHLARTEARTYSKYPFMIYQIQTKFRDELRARGGLIRVREFTMKDAYSFHTSEEDLSDYYYKVHRAYEKIYRRIGLDNVISVGSDTGMMGGKVAHEFMFLSNSGEDSLVLCKNCTYKENMEVAISKINKNYQVQMQFEEFYTPDVKNIDSLASLFDLDVSYFVKAVLFSIENSDKTLIIFIRGDLEVNEAKVKNVLNANILPFENYNRIDLAYGYIGPLNLNISTNIYVLYDESLKGEFLIGGANKKNYHIKGLDMDKIANNNFVNISKVKEGHICIKCGSELKISRGIEIGNIFQLGDKYSKVMNMVYTDAQGKQDTPVMGCYGIGIGRVLACVIEESHDDRGPIWPMSIAPWQIQICMLNTKADRVSEVGMNLYESLKNKYEVICDDRNLTAGVQFAEADLLGIPIRIIISSRNLENNEVEIMSRDKKINMKVSLENITEEVQNLMMNSL